MLSAFPPVDRHHLGNSPHTLLKRIHEYNYMKYTVPAMKQKKARRP